MNRVIKFRAWDSEQKVMVDTPWIGPDGSWADSLTFGAMKHSGKSGLMQFTGLLDKNGKEIYEGDLIKHPEYEEPLEVDFALGSFGMSHLGTNRYADELFHDVVFGTIEVIGNIYENPELLTK